jgi:hydroxypyruvate reductase/glycerate 2-kinase
LNLKKLAINIFSSALQAVNPYLLVRERTDDIYSQCVRNKCKQIVMVAFGKASYRMSEAVVKSLDDGLITQGVVITKYGHAKIQNTETGIPNRVKVFEAGHPVPDENGLKGTGQALEIIRKSGKETLVLCLISGGGSALLVSPYDGITLQEKQKTTELLLKAGADITELNTVRKHISRVKGGRLAEIAYPAQVVSLMISDVIGDKLDVIASGPTAPDTSTFHDALNVIDTYNIHQEMPDRVIEILKNGSLGQIPETPKKDSRIFRNVQNIIIGNNLRAMQAAKDKARSLGFQPEIISTEISGEARDIGNWLAEKAIKTKQSRRSICLISGGETTVTVTGNGKGGRNTELALSFSRKIEGMKGITMLSAGTDGTDGPTDAAGAIVDSDTITKAKNIGLDPDQYLNKNDSYNFFRQIDSLLITGPTGTNVMDVQIILVNPESEDIM